MDDLGISETSGAVYYGNRIVPAVRLSPPPLLLPFRLEGETPLQLGRLTADVFREESFDPLTQTRRGRIYSGRNCGSQPQEWTFSDPTRAELGFERLRDSLVQKERLITYVSDPLNRLRESLASGQLPHAILGEAPFTTSWRIVAIEGSLVGTPLLTLRPVQSFGDIPELAIDKIPLEAQKSMGRAWGNLQACVNVGGPIDRIDRCRDLLAIVFGVLAGDVRLDLGKAIETWEKKDPKNLASIQCACGRIVARLHARGKPNEQHAKQLRPPTDDDAQLAIKCTGFVLSETGWTK